MSYYRLPHIDLSTRISLALEMLNASRHWGLATHMANAYQVSRKFLYQLRNRARAGLVRQLSGQQPGPGPASAALMVDKGHLE